MNNSSNAVGIGKHIDLFKSCLINLIDGRGSIICVDGEEGFGKTFLLNEFALESSKKKYNALTIIENNQAPVGRVNIGNMQPLLPFTRVMEKILEGETFDKTSAKSKFLKSAGITFLASLPLTDMVFYAVKEFGRDWRQYKKDKSSENRKADVSSATRDYYDTFCSFAEKKPHVIMIDDFHWSDAQSIELLTAFAESIENIPIVFVITYRKSIIEAQASPLLTLVNNKNISSNNKIKLSEFSHDDISELASRLIQNYKYNSAFENRIYENSFGVPGVVIEYFNYFDTHPPFKSDGSLSDNFESGSFLPASMHSAFSSSIEKLSEDERNLLSVCSAEGRECTALIVSNLLNTDILTTIKRLRHLQNKTGIIRSVGAHVRYGVKTTIYEFTQAFYRRYFEDSLEYEEHIALHGQIASILKQKYDEADSESVKQQIAPYLAAHSIESEDNETAKSMLLMTARAAGKYGSDEIVKEVYEKFSDIAMLSEEDSNNPDYMAFREIMQNINSENNSIAELEENVDISIGSAAEINPYRDFPSSRKIIIEYYHKGRFSEAADYALDYYNKHENDLSSTEKGQLLALAIKCFIEAKEFHSAEKYADDAASLIEKNNDPIADCFVMNTLAILSSYQNKIDEALDYLTKAAQKAISLSPELRLLTLSNIALLMEEVEPAKSRRFYDSVRKLSSMLNYQEFADDVFRN